MTEWHPFPETAPKDGRPFIVFGRWNPHKDTYHTWPGGGSCKLIASWSTLLSDGDPSKYDWWTTGFQTLDNYNVTFTRWCELPEDPPDA